MKIIMGMKWAIVIVSLIVLQSQNVKCQDKLSTVSADDGSSNRRRPQPDPEYVHSGETQPSGGLYFDTADWNKEAEKWSFKGGEWGLVTLPDDDFPRVPQPSVPGPVLIAEGNSMKKVIVSRSLLGLENVSLHFSYFLTKNSDPSSSPTLQVVQSQDDTSSIVWPSDADSANVAYGQWSDGSVQLLPFNGDFDIKFIGQRIVDENDIGLDDIVLRGFYRSKGSGDEALREDNVTDITSIVPQSGNDSDTNTTQVKLTTVSSGDSVINVTTENGNNVSEIQDQVSSNSSLITESPVLNVTGTSVSNNTSNQSLTIAPDNFTSNDALNNATDNAPNTTIQMGNLTTLDALGNITDALLDNTTMPHNNQTITAISTVAPLTNATVVINSTDSQQNVSSKATTATPLTNNTINGSSTPIPQNNSTENLTYIITTIAPSINVTTFPSENNTAPIQNITNPSLNSSTQLPFTTNNGSISVTGPGGIGGTGSPPVDEPSWGVFKILLTITILGGCVLLFLYWRQRRHHDDEIALFSRSLHTDYHNPTFQDDTSPDEGLPVRGNPYNYKSFN